MFYPSFLSEPWTNPLCFILPCFLSPGPTPLFYPSFLSEPWTNPSVLSFLLFWALDQPLCFIFPSYLSPGPTPLFDPSFFSEPWTNSYVLSLLLFSIFSSEEFSEGWRKRIIWVSVCRGTGNCVQFVQILPLIAMPGWGVHWFLFFSQILLQSSLL